MRRCFLLALLVFPHAATADRLFDDRPLPAPVIGEIRPFERPYQLQPADPPTTPAPAAAPASATEPAIEPIKPFGTKGMQFGTFGAGFATNLNEANDFNLRIAWSFFVIQNLEFSTELNGWFFSQPGDDAFGINPAFLFRWHFITRERWSIFSDAGIGLLFSTDDVPDGGTSFNFTPRVGGGFTYALDDIGTRLQVGIRWHHVSNARIRGDSDNPARDGLLLYAGVIIPF
jgi:lipid A 3-O-deacylase